MRAFRHLIARLVLAVMLATVFSPSFGWEMLEGMTPHDASATLGMPLYAGGGIKNSIRAAKTRVEAGRADLREIRNGGRWPASPVPARNPVGGPFRTVALGVRHVAVERERVARHQVPGLVPHGEPHLAANDECAQRERMGVTFEHRARGPRALQHFVEAFGAGLGRELFESGRHHEAFSLRHFARTNTTSNRCRATAW